MFAKQMYQWAATLTQNGANLPFVSPLKADKLPNGFQVCAVHQYLWCRAVCVGGQEGHIRLVSIHNSTR